MFMTDNPKSAQPLAARLWMLHNRLAGKSLATLYRELAAL